MNYNLCKLILHLCKIKSKFNKLRINIHYINQLYCKWHTNEIRFHLFTYLFFHYIQF